MGSVPPPPPVNPPSNPTQEDPTEANTGQEEPTGGNPTEGSPTDGEPTEGNPQVTGESQQTEPTEGGEGGRRRKRAVEDLANTLSNAGDFKGTIQVNLSVRYQRNRRIFFRPLGLPFANFLSFNV